MEDEDSLILVDLDFLFGQNFFLNHVLLSLFGLIMVDLAFLGADKAFVEQVLIFQVIDVLISESLFAFDVILL